MEDGDIVESLVREGLPDSMRDGICISSNGAVTIHNLSNTICMTLITNIHLKQQFGKRLYCNGFIPLTPSKEKNSETGPVSSTLETPDIVIQVERASISNEVLDIGSPKSLPEARTEIKDWAEEVELVRRHSISLINRTPPKGSLAEDILTPKPLNMHAKSLMNSIQDIKEVLSEFNSCQSTLGSSSSEEEDQVDGAKSLDKSKQSKKRKKKNKKGYERGDFIKKLDNKSSPK